MRAYGGSFSYETLLNLDLRDLYFWSRKAVRCILMKRLNDLRYPRIAADMKGDVWMGEVNMTLDQLNKLDGNSPPEEEKKEGELASGWDFVKNNPIG